MLLTTTQAVQLLENGVSVYLKWDEYEYKIAPTKYYTDTYEHGYISEVLGMIVYDSARLVIDKSIKLLALDGEEILIYTKDE